YGPGVLERLISCVCGCDFRCVASDAEFALPAGIVFHCAVKRISRIAPEIGYFWRSWLHVDEQMVSRDERRDGMNAWRPIRANCSQVGNPALEPSFSIVAKLRNGFAEL